MLFIIASLLLAACNECANNDEHSADFSFLPSLFFPSICSFPFIFRSSFSPRSGPSNSFRGSVGALYAPPAGSGADPSQKRIFVFFSKRPLLSDDSY